ncbi:MAG: hypothetical protein PHD82_11330 [Candidatus Riflebacteria bacterium]|nr:hypothetical protein [Candidatus Riflebacteria bacterium]
MTASKKKISAGFAAALLFIGFLLPVIAFGLINAFFAEQKKVAEMREFAALADSAAQQLEPRCENAEFWCHELNRMFAETGKAGEFKTSLQKLADKHQQKISWILWDAGNRVIDKNITSQHTDAIWNRVGGILRSASEVWFRLMGRDDDAFIRSILGEHVQTKTFSRATFRSNPTLNSLSFSRPAGRFWADFNEHMGAIVIFPPGIDGKSHGIKEFLNGFDLNSTGIVLGNEEFFFSNMPDKTPETLASLKIDLADRTPEILHTQKEIYTGRYVGRNLFFCLFRPDTGRYSTNGNTLLFSAVLAFLWVLILNKIFHERLNTGLSIRYIVFGIITCSNIFPLLIMGILGQQYLEQKRHILIEEQRSEAVNFLKQIEGEFVAETHKIKNFAIKHINKLGEILQHESMSLENTGDFRKKMAQVSGKFMVVASTTIPTLSDAAFLGPEKSVLLGDENHQSLWFVETSDKETMDRIKLNETMSKCGAAFIAFYNGTSLSDQLLTEVEIIIEALFQAKLNATFHSFLRVLDHVENVGLGTEKHPTFMQFLSFNPVPTG